MPTASATAEPDMPANIKLEMTLTCPIPPRNRPTKALQKAINLSLIAPSDIKFAAMMKSGTESKV